jgi:PAS domain S-box-containing protein
MLVANKQVQKMFGYKKTEIEGKNISMMMPQPFSQRHNGYLRNFVNTGTSD